MFRSRNAVASVAIILTGQCSVYTGWKQLSFVTCVEMSQYWSARFTNCCCNISPKLPATGGFSLMIEMVAPWQVCLFRVPLVKYVLLTVKLNTVNDGFQGKAQMDSNYSDLSEICCNGRSRLMVGLHIHSVFINSSPSSRSYMLLKNLH